MSKYMDELEILIAKKKKKEPNNSEKKEFDIAWTNLVEEQGFSAAAENFLYDGLVFCGAKPFMNYMNKKNNRIEALNELYNGKLFGKNCANTSSLLIHLLGLFLNEQKEDATVLISLIQHIPSALKNKEGKRYGQGDRAFKKYLFEGMEPETKFLEPDILLNQGLDMDSLKEFKDVINDVAGKLDSGKLSDTCRSNMHRFTEWIQSFNDKKGGRVVSENSSQSYVDAKEKEESTSEGKSDLDRLFCELHGLRQEVSALERLRIMFERDTEEYKNRIVSQDEIIQTNSKELSLKNQRINDLLQENDKLNQEIASQEEVIHGLKDNISQREEMIQMIKRDRSKQAEEGINRLTSKLKSYYTDYQDAKDLEMSVELGENIRDQFGEVLSLISSFISSSK